MARQPSACIARLGVMPMGSNALGVLWYIKRSGRFSTFPQNAYFRTPSFVRLGWSAFQPTTQKLWSPGPKKVAPVSGTETVPSSTRRRNVT